MATFWAEALGYEVQPPPEGFDTWRDYWLSVGLPQEELGEEEWHDSIVHPSGDGPRVWFQEVPEPKFVKNRFHFDILVGGGRSVPFYERKVRVRAEVARLEGLGATKVHEAESPDIDHLFVGMADPEGNEFDVV